MPSNQSFLKILFLLASLLLVGALAGCGSDELTDLVADPPTPSLIERAPTITPRFTETPAAEENDSEAVAAVDDDQEGTAVPSATPPPTETATPRPTATPTPQIIPTNSPGCFHFIQYLADVTLPDGSRVPPGAPLTKTWEVENQGSCALTPAFTLTLFGGQIPIVELPPLPVILPGESAEISILLEAPQTEGRVVATWRFDPVEADGSGQTEAFGSLTVDIVVDAEAEAPEESQATSTPTPSPTAEAAADTSPTPIPEGETSTLSGSWAVSGYVFGPDATLSQEAADAWLGQELVLEENRLTFDTSSCSNLTLVLEEPRSASELITDVPLVGLGLAETAVLTPLATGCILSEFNTLFLTEAGGLIVRREGAYFIFE